MSTIEQKQIPAGVTVNACLLYAADAHGKQTRGGQPYLIHLLECVTILEDEFGVTDEVTLSAAACHDILEDTGRTRDELVEFVGPVVTAVVEEATDDLALNPCERKAVKLTMASQGAFSYRARLVMLADKLSNVRSLDKAKELPPGWTEKEVKGYMLWCCAIGSSFVESSAAFGADEARLLTAMNDKLVALVRKSTGLVLATAEADLILGYYLNNVKASN
jgi:(p)ppGpp synthase/HD superfamily hydrolase